MDELSRVEQSVTVLRWHARVPEVLNKLSQKGKFLALKTTQTLTRVSRLQSGELVYTDDNEDQPEDSTLLYKQTVIEMPFFHNDQSFKLIRLDGVGWVAQSSQALLVSLGLQPWSKGNLSRLDEYYQNNWRYYCSTNKLFSLDMAKGVPPALDLFRAESLQMPWPMPQGRGRLSPLGFYSQRGAELADLELWREWEDFLVNYCDACERRQARINKDEGRSQLLMQRVLGKVQTTFKKINPWEN